MPVGAEASVIVISRDDRGVVFLIEAGAGGRFQDVGDDVGDLLAWGVQALQEEIPVRPPDGYG